MTSLWFQLLVCTGITAILVNGTILDIPRNYLKSKSKHFNSLITCSLCTGFWVGIAIGSYENYYLKHIIYMGFASAILSWFVDSLIGALQSIDVGMNK